ncbi:hypothetical protein Pla100_25530 [Neorhodopirellula pilleata]|uniref:Xylosidase/arabinosidase n=2 Tax=Neorhodopirellula pilleata TaxID=2714738 RepID=A0A5C6AEA3_9BACT|nr:hypothetical protein Pla100_25530 [Neorhodopirellula pilleata]
MCGYQGWFNCEGDGADLSWAHWARHGNQTPGPGNVTVDLWPELEEYDADERYPTNFVHMDGSSAEVFSSANRKTVLRHFKWMQDYGIDGAFVQRFANGVGNDKLRRHKDSVLKNAMDGSNQYGRAFAVMYDLSGMRTDDPQLVQNDWLALQRTMNVAQDTAYLNHDGHPVVAIWGIGFSDNRPYSLEYCSELIDWFKQQGCTVMLGIPSFWREQTRDAVTDAMMHEVLRKADILSPWTIGRYRTPDQATRHAQEVWAKDQQWCDRNDLDFLPVVFPGFSWHNLIGAELNDIPRLKGQFLWSQIAAAKRIDASMIYVAMFDEVDEATAIFKCTNNPPVGAGVAFSDYEGLPSDFYLRLTGQAGRLLRGEIGDDFPFEEIVSPGLSEADQSPTAAD